MDELGNRLATAHGRKLLAAFGLDRALEVRSDPPAIAWRRTGLKGRAPPVALTAAADGALAALRSLGGCALPLDVRGSALLGERARLLGLGAPGAVSANGSCRLLATANGHVALNLPRAEDWELLPALFGVPAASWDEAAQAARPSETATLMAQARLLGLAIADAAGGAAAVPFRVARLGRGREASSPPLVVDLSALWAGPLAGSLLAAMGARVVKVESVRRPDGARAGHAGFFDLLNDGKASMALDFANPADVAGLHRLIDAADIVIEASRPRALAQLGLDAAAVARRGATWLSITAHGREGPAAQWIGYGDDAAVAGGLAAAMARAWGAPYFAGDAIADPLTGITAALAAWASWVSGGGRLVALALAEVVAHACTQPAPLDAGRDEAPLYPLRAVPARAAALGADSAAVFAVLSGR